MRTLREEQDSLFFCLFCCYLFCYKFFFSLVLTHWRSLCALVWAWMCIFFLHHALYALRAILCAASLVGQEMLYRFYMYMCTPAWAVFFFFSCVCVSVCAFVWEIKSVIHHVYACIENLAAWYKPCEDLIFPRSSLCQHIDEGKEPANYSQATKCGQYCFEIWSLTR